MIDYKEYYFRGIRKEFLKREDRRENRDDCDKNHEMYLENLIDNLHYVGEDRKNIQWIIKDGVWKKENSFNKIKLGDLLIGYYDGHGMPIELKGSRKQISSAKIQITQGKEFLENVMGLFVPYGKIVIFDEGFYETYIYDFQMKKRYDLFTRKNMGDI